MLLEVGSKKKWEWRREREGESERIWNNRERR